MLENRLNVFLYAATDATVEIISNPKFEPHAIIRARYVKKVERKLLTVLMVFSIRVRFLRCIKYIIKCIFAGETICSGSAATTKTRTTRSSTLKMVRGVSERLTLRKRERRKKLRSLRAPDALCLLNSERPALRVERHDPPRRAARRAPLKQSPADCLEEGFHHPPLAPLLLPPAAPPLRSAPRMLPTRLKRRFSRCCAPSRPQLEQSVDRSSQIVRCEGVATQLAQPGIQRARPGLQRSRPGIKLARPGTKRARPGIQRARSVILLAVCVCVCVSLARL